MVITLRRILIKTCEYRLIPITDLEKYQSANTKQRAFDAAFEVNANVENEGEKVKVVKVITDKKGA